MRGGDGVLIASEKFCHLEGWFWQNPYQLRVSNSKCNGRPHLIIDRGNATAEPNEARLSIPCTFGRICTAPKLIHSLTVLQYPPNPFPVLYPPLIANNGR